MTKKFNLNLQIEVDCKEEEIKEVKKRLSNLIIANTKYLEGLLTTSLLPWKKSYYFSVKNVKEKKCKSLKK